MPIPGEELILEPRHPAAAIYKEIDEQYATDTDEKHAGAEIINIWYSKKHSSDIVIYRENGVTKWGLIPGIHHLKHDLTTLGCSVAWSIESESKAIQMLAGLLSHHAFKHYMLTGMFLETSKRSGVTYVFRRLRPTVAIKASTGVRFKSVEEQMKILCCLCLHPIGYYADSWAGSMCPTDDVIAHLLLMRGDEPMFWKRANQIAPHRPNAGL
jgi:hypothetical protein